MLNIGDTLQQNRYRVNKQLGAGGMATVYEVFDRRLRTKFALKGAFGQTPEERVQFEHEAQLLAQLDHPVLPRIVDHFSERGAQFLVMELVPGDDLEQLLQRQGQPFDVAIVLQWAEQLLDALAYLHSQNPPIIHRDIKPSNLKIAGTGRIKLLDFGIAKQQFAGGHTVTVAKAFSLEYSPIEQFGVNTHTDARSDIYALGATLYHLVTNQAPVPAPDRLNGRPLPGPRTFNPSCPPALAQAILRAMAPKATDRFQSAGEFRAAIQHVRNQFNPPAPQSAQHHQRLVLGAGATVSVALLGYLIGTIVFGPPGTIFGGEPTQMPPVTLTSTSIESATATIDPPAPTIVAPTANPTQAVSATVVPPAATAPPPTAAPPTHLPATAPAAAPQTIDPPAIIARAAWGAAPPRSASQAQQPQRITLNHDGQELSRDADVPPMLRRIQSIHQRKWADIAWHYIIDLDGNIYEGRSPNEAGDTNYHYDTHGIIAIGVLGDYDQQVPSPRQIETIVTLMAWLCQQYGIPPDAIYPHSYFANQSSLTDPKITSPGANFDIDAIRSQVAARLTGR